MDVLVVGGTGHIGSYLVPRLVRAGHDVTVISRRSAPQYTDPNIGWPNVSWIEADRRMEEQAGTWQTRMEQIDADVVIDLICFTPEQNALMVDAFHERIRHFLHCGTIWSYGPSSRTPYREHYPRRPIGDYGIQKAEIEADMLAYWRDDGFPMTIVHPGHICGREWLPIDPQGTRNGVDVYRKLASGEVVHLPRYGRETLHHVHGDDVAQMFDLALHQPEASLGEMFSAVAPYAMSLVGCCEAVARAFAQEPNLEFVDYAEMARILGKEAWAMTETHIEHSPCSSIEKAQRLLGYAPRYTTEEIYEEVIAYLLENGELEL